MNRLFSRLVHDNTVTGNISEIVVTVGYSSLLIKKFGNYIISLLYLIPFMIDPERCNNLKKFYPDSRKFYLLKRKGVYQYDYEYSVDKLAESSLPPKEAFYSRLNDESISDEDYEHAKTVWKEFRIKTLEEYTALYNEVNVATS